MMKKSIAGIIALLIPVILFAQTAKEAQDLTQVMNKIKKVEKENLYLKKQTGSLQATATSLTEQLTTLHKKITANDSIVRSGQDTVSSYSARISTAENKTAQLSGALLTRTWIFLILLALIIVFFIVFWVVVSNRQSLDKAELIEKLKAQRDERERRISEVIVLIESVRAEQTEFNSATRDRLANISGQLLTVEEQIRNELKDQVVKSDQQHKETFDRLKESQNTIKDEWVMKLSSLQKQINDAVSGLQKELQNITRAKS